MNKLKLLKAELLHYPIGHVARSVGYMELIPKEVALGDCDLIRGASFNMLNQPTARWMYQFGNVEWNALPEEVRKLKIKKFVDIMIVQVREYFWKKGAFWGVAPEEKLIL